MFTAKVENLSVMKNKRDKKFSKVNHLFHSFFINCPFTELKNYKCLKLVQAKKKSSASLMG